MLFWLDSYYFSCFIFIDKASALVLWSKLRNFLFVEKQTKCKIDQKIFWSHAFWKSYENSGVPIFLEGSGGPEGPEGLGGPEVPEGPVGPKGLSTLSFLSFLQLFSVSI